jgi:hypothetical protein
VRSSVSNPPTAGLCGSWRYWLRNGSRRVLTHGRARAPFTHRNGVPADSFPACTLAAGNEMPAAALAGRNESACDGGLNEERRTST